MDNLSLPTEERACRGYCTRQGWAVDRVFQDKGESAKSADRPQLIQLIEYCRKAKGVGEREFARIMSSST